MDLLFLYKLPIRIVEKRRVRERDFLDITLRIRSEKKKKEKGKKDWVIELKRSRGKAHVLLSSNQASRTRRLRGEKAKSGGRLSTVTRTINIFCFRPVCLIWRNFSLHLHLSTVWEEIQLHLVRVSAVRKKWWYLLPTWRIYKWWVKREKGKNHNHLKENMSRIIIQIEINWMSNWCSTNRPEKINIDSWTKK